MDIQVLRTKDLIDPFTGIHYAYHRSLKEITFAHTHDFFEIFLIAKGRAVHVINEKREILEENSIVFIRPHDIHNYEMLREENCELINLAFPVSVIDQLFEYFGEGYNKDKLLNAAFPAVIKIPAKDKEVLITRFEGLNVLSRKSKSRLKTEFRILIAEIFSHYFMQMREENNKGIPDWLLKIREEMEKKENFILGISRMYELSERSPEHLSRSFKKYFNETLTEFINHLRLNYAANLLANSDTDISGIALESGFENLSYFYHKFKRLYGDSPKEFRLKHQKMIIPF